MKIGILTFHWATNYGAVLQAFALQEYLQSLGHNVEIINYKPIGFDFLPRYLRRPWLMRNLRQDLIGRKKEKKLKIFREKYLKMTKRYFTTKQMTETNFDYDLVISGSDQVLNPTFTLSGEEKPTSAYFLSAFPQAMRIGYAVSFGCNKYPEEALKYARKWIENFDKVGVREQTGGAILEEMGFKGAKQLVPDPTILRGKSLFKDIKITYQQQKDYVCAYILRKHIKIPGEKVVYIDDFNNPLSMEEWLGTIIGSKYLITNSYHGMIMAILNHVPFSVLADSSDMNDRFYTLLNTLGLSSRIANHPTEVDLNDNNINWELVENKINAFRIVASKLLDIYM